jgi:hypothetical protein
MVVVVTAARVQHSPEYMLISHLKTFKQRQGDYDLPLEALRFQETL